MEALKILLVFGIICLLSNIQVESLYHKFFAYGDKDKNLHISEEECLGNSNAAFQYECAQMWALVPAKVRNQTLGITKAQFRDMSVPGGIDIYAFNLYISMMLK